MKTIIIICLMLLSTLANLNAQNEDCGTELNQVQTDYMDATRATRDAMDVSNLDPVSVPLVAHVIRRTDGTGGLSTVDLNTAMTQLNTAYSQLDVDFQLCEVNYIDSDYYHDNNLGYSNSQGSDEYNLAMPNRVNDKVNVFFLPNIVYCGWSSFPSYKQAYDKDWTIMKNTCAINGSTLAHELGHYFNLYHTHQGPSSSINIYEYELVNGSNCGPNVGDELCDTPADPRLSGCVSTSCQYTCNSTDANGDLYQPDPTNIMSYSQKVCRTLFSLQQRSRMLQSLLFDRSNLAASCNFCQGENLTLSGTITSGNTEELVASNNIVSTQTIQFGANVNYQAGNKIQLLPGFTAENGCDFHAQIASCPSGNLLENAPSENSARQVAKVPTSPNDLQLSCNPNPFTNQTSIAYQLETDGSIILQVFDATGRQIAQLVNDFQAKGQYQVQFHAGNYPVGMYYARLQSGQSSKTIKLVITRK